MNTPVPCLADDPITDLMRLRLNTVAAFSKQLFGSVGRSLLLVAALLLQVVTSRGEEIPSASSNPEPLAWCILHPSLSPKEVSLTKATAFPIMMDGKVSGNISASPGCVVPVVMIEPQGVTVTFGGSQAMIPVESTDLINRLQASKEWTAVLNGTAGATAVHLSETRVFQPHSNGTQGVAHTVKTPSVLSVTNKPGGGEPAGPTVSLTRSGNNLILSNGILTATIVPGARISSLKYKGLEMAHTIYYSMDGGKNYRTPGGGQYFVKTETPDLVDIGFKNLRKSEPQAVDCEIHYVLKRGASGLYTYAILHHPADYPATGVGEWRLVWKLSNDLLEKIYVDDLRHWQMPSSEDYKTAKPTGIKEITQLTTGPWAGKYDCKYDYSASYHDIGCWGHASDRNKVGGWIILGGYDYFNDGPTKQDLNAASGINHIHFGMNHYNGSSVRLAEGQSWEKVFGPFLLYCNSDPSGGDACWGDAKAQVIAEKGAWPYSWLTNIPAYPVTKERGAVSGRLIIKDSLKPQLNPTNTWVGIFDPSGGKNWQFDSMGYQYWTKADSQGNFIIPAVRPGTYTLYAFSEGVVGEFSRADVSVSAGGTNILGAVQWDVPHKGTSIAWEIGVPDRTAREFRHGKDYFHGYVWQNFQNEFSNPLEYTVGKSDPSKDWNYAQSWYQSGDQRVPWKWRIHFNIPKVPPSGNATLTLAFASAHGGAHVNVFVNDEGKPMGMVTPRIQGGNALLRESIHAKYCVEYFTIPVSSLREGENTITLEQVRTDTQTHVMYDYVNLELP